jgi:hypothetical protein
MVIGCRGATRMLIRMLIRVFILRLMRTLMRALIHRQGGGGHMPVTGTGKTAPVSVERLRMQDRRRSAGRQRGRGDAVHWFAIVDNQLTPEQDGCRDSKRLLGRHGGCQLPILNKRKTLLRIILDALDRTERGKQLFQLGTFAQKVDVAHKQLTRGHTKALVHGHVADTGRRGGLFATACAPRG